MSGQQASVAVIHNYLANARETTSVAAQGCGTDSWHNGGEEAMKAFKNGVKNRWEGEIICEESLAYDSRIN